MLARHLARLRNALKRAAVRRLRRAMGLPAQPSRASRSRSAKPQRFACPLCRQEVIYLADRPLRLSPDQQAEMCVLQHTQHKSPVPERAKR
jgi:hypothetical protein